MQLQEKPLKLNRANHLTKNLESILLYIVGKLTIIVCESNKYPKYLNMRY